MRLVFSRSAAIIAALVLVLTTLSSALAHSDNPAFIATWTRTDQPVAEDAVDRTWIWGPLTTAWGETEKYVEGINGERDVLYFDKARMEITRPDGNPDDLWYVTNGLLVMEMITGQMQMGDASFVDHGAAQFNVAGDADDPNGPTYASFANLLDVSVAAPVDVITRTIARDGSVADDGNYASYAIGANTYIAATGHWVADPFWAFMTSTGPVWEDGELVMDKLFEDPVYGTGYPVTEAYWAEVIVGDVAQDVLMQCFQRRCLTYTPANDPGWKVEAGNVGQHYYHWRYGHEMPGADSATGYMVAVGDDGVSGIPVGCQDSLVAITIPVWPTDSLEAKIAATLTVLLSYNDVEFGASGLRNALYMNDATVDSVAVEDGVATVNLSGTIPSGGVCDDPRITGQLEETVKAFDGVDQAIILLNGESLFPAP